MWGHFNCKGTFFHKYTTRYWNLLKLQIVLELGNLALSTTDVKSDKDMWPGKEICQSKHELSRCIGDVMGIYKVELPGSEAKL